MKNKKDFYKTEIIAGLTTFMTMSYILATNPDILQVTGMDKNALFTATVLVSMLGTLFMGLYAKLPLAIAPAMGLNAFFAFSVVIGMKHSWEFALTAILLEGIIFFILSLSKVRESIFVIIPKNLQIAFSIGIGLFIAFIGLKSSGVIVKNTSTILALGDLTSKSVLLTLSGLFITSFLLYKRVKGALLLGILITTFIGIPLGITKIPANFILFRLPPSIEPIFFKFDFSFIYDKKKIIDMLVIVFSFLFVDVFDTLGTLVGISYNSNILKNDSKKLRRGFIIDSLASIVGAILGTSTVTTYVENLVGITEGGRTGVTAIVIAFLFLLSLFFSPLFLMIPSEAIAPILILIGLFMMKNIKKIDLDDITESLPVFLTILSMPLSYSIANGIMLGILSYTLLKLMCGKYKSISKFLYPLSIIFIIYIFMGKI